jgi:protein kinase-like protein
MRLRYRDVMGLVSTVPHATGSAATLVLRDRDDGPRCVPIRLGRYEICDVVGKGAMGVVYRAHDPVLGRAVAIKLVHSQGTRASRWRVLGEARALARLRHPHVIPIFDVGTADAGVFVTMPLVEGGTLRDWLRGGRSLDAILDAFVAAGHGLAAAHAAGIIHRDFKPDNVLLGAGGEIYVADFGLARVTGSAAPVDPNLPGDGTRTGAVVGTPAYMAPEQLRGEASDARADQFSFCVALWEGIHGARPFRGPEQFAEDTLRDRLAAIAAGPRPRPGRPGRSAVPAWIAPLLLRGLATERDARWPSLDALLAAIDAHRTRRRRWRRIAVEVAAVAAAASLIAMARPAPRPRPGAERYPVVPLAHLADLRAAAISPDGARFALVTGDALVIEDRAGGGDRVVVEHGVQAPIAWAPDGRRVLVGTVPALAPIRETMLVDVDGGAAAKLPVTGAAAFLSDGEAVVVGSPRDHTITFVRLDGPPEVVASCPVAGDYTFLWHASGLPDGAVIVETETVDRATHGLVVVDRGCHATRLTAEPIADYALSDSGTILALVKHDSGDDIVELSRAGAELSRRRTTGALGGLIGRRRGVDYVTTRAPRSELVRVHGGEPTRLLSLDGDASIYPAPGGREAVWITHAGPQRAGQLWLAQLAHLNRSRVILGNALTAGWSPAGHRLAALVDDATAPAGPPAPADLHPRALVVLDANLTVTQRIALADADPEAAPVWLDEQRIAVRSGDRARYRWYDIDAPDRGDHGEIGDRRSGSMLWLARSPRDGALAMWKMGAPEAIARTEHLWLQPPGDAAAALHVDEAARAFLVPSWTPSGELLVRSLQTGVVSRVALDTGELTRLAQLPETPLSQLFDDHLVALDGGDLLAVNHELGADVAMIGPGSER